MSSSEEKKKQILGMLEQGMSSVEIAGIVGVGKMVVAGYKAALTKAQGRAASEVADAVETTFGLERDLQRALRQNIKQLERGLSVTDNGKEQRVTSGFIDITAKDERGRTVIIELKAGTADRETIGQILGYIGDVSKRKKPVRGIIVAGDFAPSAIAAVRVLPNVQLKQYDFKFSFKSVGSNKT
jgi:RecB family endonuclease NucS